MESGRGVMHSLLQAAEMNCMEAEERAEAEERLEGMVPMMANSELELDIRTLLEDHPIVPDNQQVQEPEPALFSRRDQHLISRLISTWVDTARNREECLLALVNSLQGYYDQSGSPQNGTNTQN